MEGGRQVTIATGTGRADGSVQLGDSILQVPGFTATDGQLVRLLLAYGAVVPLTGGSSSGGGGGPHAHPEYVEAAGDRMTGQLVVPSLGVVDEGDGQGQAPRFIVDAGPAGQNLIIGRPDGSGLAVGSADGLGYLHTGGGDYYRLLDVRDAGTLNAYLPTMYPETGQPGDLNSLDAGAYMVHGASTPYPSNMPRPFIVGDGDWLILAYGDAPIGNVGLGSAWQLALHHGEVYVRAASFMSPDTGWRCVSHPTDAPVQVASSASTNATPATYTTIPGCTITIPNAVKGGWYEAQGTCWGVVTGTSGDLRLGIAASGAGGLSLTSSSSVQDMAYLRAISGVSPYQSMSCTRQFQALEHGVLAASLQHGTVGSPTAASSNYARLRLRRIA